MLRESFQHVSHESLVRGRFYARALAAHLLLLLPVVSLFSHSMTWGSANLYALSGKEIWDRISWRLGVFATFFGAAWWLTDVLVTGRKNRDRNLCRGGIWQWVKKVWAEGDDDQPAPFPWHAFGWWMVAACGLFGYLLSLPGTPWWEKTVTFMLVDCLWLICVLWYRGAYETFQQVYVAASDRPQREEQERREREERERQEKERLPNAIKDLAEKFKVQKEAIQQSDLDDEAKADMLLLLDRQQDEQMKKLLRENQS